MRVYYFGWYDRPGHGYHEPGGRSCAAAWDLVPFGTLIDARWLPKSKRYGAALDVEQPEGVVHRMTKNGWTAIGWWDRSGDSRGNSHSSFVFEGDVSVEEGLARARELFPEVFARMSYEIVPAELHA